MRRRVVLLHVVLATALALAGVLLLDPLVARFLHESGFESAWLFARGTELLDIATGKEVSKFLIGGLVFVTGAALSPVARSKAVGWALLFVGSIQLLSTLVTGVSKNFFGRLRPYQLIENSDWNNAWFADGSAFPSGHAGFYFGLFLPLAFLFPCWRWPLLVVPWFIACARVVANDHFVSDVAASIAVVGLITLLFARILKPRIGSDSQDTGVNPH